VGWYFRLRGALAIGLLPALPDVADPAAIGLSAAVVAADYVATDLVTTDVGVGAGGERQCG
jgi:hypothetical protein